MIFSVKKLCLLVSVAILQALSLQTYSRRNQFGKQKGRARPFSKFAEASATVRGETGLNLHSEIQFRSHDVVARTNRLAKSSDITDDRKMMCPSCAFELPYDSALKALKVYHSQHGDMVMPRH